MQLTSSGGEVSTDNGDIHLIDTMDVESLVQRAVEGPVVESTEGMQDADFY
jgi:hypothetical protein